MHRVILPLARRAGRTVVLSAIVFAAACSSDSTSPEESADFARGGQQGPDFRASAAAQSKHSERLMAIDGVEGHGLSLGANGEPDGMHRVVYDGSRVYVCSKPLEIDEVRPSVLAHQVLGHISCPGADHHGAGGAATLSPSPRAARTRPSRRRAPRHAPSLTRSQRSVRPKKRLTRV